MDFVHPQYDHRCPCWELVRFPDVCLNHQAKHKLESPSILQPSQDRANKVHSGNSQQPSCKSGWGGGWVQAEFSQATEPHTGSFKPAAPLSEAPALVAGDTDAIKVRHVRQLPSCPVAHRFAFDGFCWEGLPLNSTKPLVFAMSNHLSH